ncbi:flagellar protein FlaG [Marinobacterium sp. D7]|uniref:flagellar protein FlaG n=1 Tax=Marinobacterium ramblicola TaxID=2849041 RepID=UPI001C2D91AF|nr:flagellar protein FlaG [Marinobacterium ramblicola]MBV1788865.1 flagellar protein FlaG [Marinobacterium ramblicola]
MAIDSLTGVGSDRGQVVRDAATIQNDLRPVKGSEVGTRAVEESAATQKKSEYKQPESSVVKEAAAQLGEVLKLVSSNLNISVDDDLGETVVKVVNADNKEVIRQIPSEEILSLMKRLSEISEQYTAESSGLLLRDEA